MKNKTVWRVKYVLPIDSVDQNAYNIVADQVGSPDLRLLLISNAAFARSGKEYLTGTIYKKMATSRKDLHIIDNLELTMKEKSNGDVDQVEISYLLEDLRLMQTHMGIVVDMEQGYTLFFIGDANCDRPSRVDPYKKPYPWSWDDNPPVLISDERHLIAESCQETESIFTIRFKSVHCKEKEPLSGIIMK